jgi:hypothetical protein
MTRHTAFRGFGSRLALLGAVALFAVAALAQNSGKPGEGYENGNYIYQGSFEFGYRFVDTKSAANVYDTFVNQQQGPRLLEQTLSLRSRNHAGALFDNLFFSSFGWGGDPDNAGRLRVSKNKWYNFNYNFRRDQNFWDFNLLANPLNPTSTLVQVNNSPHLFNTKRRMYDASLIIAPQSPVRLRLGYTRNRSEGPSLSSIHEGTDTAIFQNWSTTLDAYQIGVDVRLLPRTNISYDQFLQYYKGDTSWQDNSFGFQLAGGIPVDAGIVENLTANQPCAAPVSGAPPTYNPACNGIFGYQRTTPLRNSYPTEQLTVQSNYFRRLDISARVSYSGADAKVSNFSEVFAGLATRTRQRVSDVTVANGANFPASSKRIVANADLGVTIRVTDKLRLIDTLRFSNFRIPGSSDLLSTSFFGATLLSTPNVFDPATCPPPFTAATCPQHSSSSGADIITSHLFTFLRQRALVNTIEAEYDFSHHFSGHLGFRYENRDINHDFELVQDQTFFPSLPNRGACAGIALNPDGSCSVVTLDGETNPIPIHGYSTLFGFTLRPADSLRVNFDTEFYSGDNTSTRITPRQSQHYKARVSYRPERWINVSGSMNLLEARNNVSDILHKEHNRNFGFAVNANPNERFGFDLGYNYDNIFSTTNICFVSSTPPPGLASCGTTFLTGISTYTNRVNYAYGAIMVKPIKRVTASLGYDLVSTAGNTLILTPTQGTLGPLAFNYHRPSASVAFDLARGVTFNTRWGYYGYNEKSDPGTLVPGRDFHSNQATLSLRYAF